MGKTLFSLKFLASDLADVGRCMYLGFYDSPARLVAKAEAASIRLRHAVDEGRLLVQWAPSIALAVDELAARCSRRSAVTPSRVW